MSKKNSSKKKSVSKKDKEEKTQKIKKVVSSIDSFEKSFPEVTGFPERKKALETYFKYKGIIKIFPSSNPWPKLIYPEGKILDKKLEDLKVKKNLYSKKLSSWKKRYSSAERYHQTNQIKKIKEPLYWKHLSKLAVDQDYRSDFKKVNLPVHLVADNKWRPMVKMFVNDIEYRKQLVETVNTSIVYKKDKRVAKYADDLKDFRMEASSKKIKEIEKKLEAANEIQKALIELKKWYRT